MVSYWLGIFDCRHTIATMIVQSSIPGCPLFILDSSRSNIASIARTSPTIAVIEIVLVLFRSGQWQIPPVVFLVAIDLRNLPKMFARKHT
jgi:hypothetical protein